MAGVVSVTVLVIVWTTIRGTPVAACCVPGIVPTAGVVVAEGVVVTAGVVVTPELAVTPGVALPEDAMVGVVAAGVVDAGVVDVFASAGVVAV